MIQQETPPNLEQPHLNRPNFFGKHQRKINYLVMILVYQMPFIVSTIVLLYSFIYFDYRIWILYLAITIIQFPIGRCGPYIRFANKYINPLIYFNSFKRIYEEEIPNDKQKCMFSFHPHSVFGFGMLANMSYQENDPLSRMVGLVSRVIFNTPIIGLLLRLWGVQPVNSSNLKRLLANNQNVGLVPGGFEEATLTTAKEMRIFIQNRKGFIKYALKYNYTVYPTFVFNQHQGFYTFDKFLNFRMLMNKIKLPGVIFFHPITLFFYPPNLDLVTVVGKGLKGKEYGADEEPSTEEIEDMHKKYINELKRIYHKHKELNGNKPLVMF